MQVQDEQSGYEVIRALQRQLDELTADNLLLKEQLVRKEQFTAMIAHELRSPLTPIINYAQIAARPNSRRESIERATNIIISQAWRLKRLVNDLLDASRLSSGKFTLMCSRCDLVALVKDVVEQLRPVAPYHTFVVEAADSAMIGKWDNDRLQQALGNLLDNAIKYSDDGTRITVHAWQTAGTAYVSVHNQGVAIPLADADQLFHPYVRLQTASMQQGAGLGLYITKCIIEAHGGELRLEQPPDEGQGTTFSFDLPL